MLSVCFRRPGFSFFLQVLRWQEEIQVQLEQVGDDMEKMSQLLDELDSLTKRAVDLDVKLLDKKIDQMMPELGFAPEDNDRQVVC